MQLLVTMEGKRMAKLFEAAKGVVFPDEVVGTEYGPKMALGGDTYNAFVEDGVKEALDWESTHRSWSDKHEAWLVDPNDESLDAVEEAVEEAGYQWHGVAADVVSFLMEEVKVDDAHLWERYGVEMVVMYEGKKNGKMRSKKGVVVGVDPEENKVFFERDDGTVNYVRGNGLYCQNPRYPYVGGVTEVGVEWGDEAKSPDSVPA